MNTAVLTGRQVSQAMKVFIVSQAGKVADVTLQSSCHSEDESVLKVWDITFLSYNFNILFNRWILIYFLQNVWYILCQFNNLSKLLNDFLE